MRFLRLSDAQYGVSDDIGEDGPGIQYVFLGEALAVLVGGWVIVEFGDGLARDFQFEQFAWLATNLPLTEREAAFDLWFNGLPVAENAELLRSALDYDISYWLSQGFRLRPDFPGGGPPPGPMPPPYGCGRLPFDRHCGPDDVYYRFEHFPKSRRILASRGLVVPGTFASPQSELPFLPTGFSVVARCALPLVFPACFRWELQPVSATPMACGAIIPYFGQSGGDVEVCFERGATNRGPIANPIIIPAL